MILNHWGKRSELTKVITAHFTKKPVFETEALKMSRNVP